MTITLNSDLFKEGSFQASFKEKLKSARYYDYDFFNSFTGLERKHYQYCRAAKGVLGEFGFIGYLIENNIDFVYNKKVDNRKYSPDIDFYIPSINAKIDVKSGFTHWKKPALVKYGIDYVVVSTPMIEHKEGVYRKNGYMMLESYRQLFKNNITIDLNGFISTADVLDQGPTYELKSIDKLF